MATSLLSKPKSYPTSICTPSIRGLHDRGIKSALLAAPDAAVADLSKLTVPQLKGRLRGLGLTVGGRKSELIDRLNEHYDSNEVTAIQSAVDEVDSYDLGEDGEAIDEPLGVEDDEIIDAGAGKLAIGQHSVMFLIGTTIDYKKDIIGAMFDIQNPNAQSSCGCGVSVNFDMDKIPQF